MRKKKHTKRNTNWSCAVGGVVLRGNEILLVRHTYGAAKGQLLIPGGHLNHSEMPEAAIVREIYEETGVTAVVKGLLGVRFRAKNWYAIFLLDYLSGEPKSDDDENNFTGFIALEEAMRREDLTEISKYIIETVINGIELIPLNDFYARDDSENRLHGLNR